MINQCHANFQSIKQYASDLQTFLGIREIELKVNETEQYLQSLIQAKGFEQLELVCKIDKGVQNILNGLKHFGSTEIKARPSNFEYSRAKDKQAELQVLEGDFLITDHCAIKQLTVLASDGTLKYSMSLDPSEGYDITLVDEKTVAITSGQTLKKTGIDILNIRNRTKKKFIKLLGPPYGITSDHDSLLVCVEGRGIYKVNTMDYSSCRVISCILPAKSYVSVFADKIYYTNDKDHSVVCCDRNGDCIWTFKDDSVLKWAKGITVDNDGNVYVVGQGSSNMLIISNDGKHHKEILSEEDGLCAPSAIFFDKQKRELLVTNL
ncbi:unnamed protein product [Mytilus coruscus]|uniref:TRIM2_3 n=1 Tax=Mytilus coruscus TaxID=42192 RepID=A0A6J8D389_MYTCO|nr:unnamed protein product [Mytilus coruscus]